MEGRLTARSHSHWPGGPTCRFPTKKECDEFYRAWKKQQKLEYEEKERQKEEQRRQELERIYADYEAKERERVAEVLAWAARHYGRHEEAPVVD